jgi:hypothetical protein
MGRINDGSYVINLASDKVRIQTALFDEFCDTGLSEKWDATASEICEQTIPISSGKRCAHVLATHS